MRTLLTITTTLVAAVLFAIFFDEIHDWITDAPTTARAAVSAGDLENLKEIAKTDWNYGRNRTTP